MRNWFANVFRSPDEPAPSAPAVTEPAGRAPKPPATPPVSSATRQPVEGTLTTGDVEFLDGLVHPPERQHLDDLPKSDRLFLAGIVKRLHARQLDVPVFPEAAIRLSEMLRQSDVPVNRYVALLNEDPALSVEVLKVANSAFYGSAKETTSLGEAIMRVGLTRLQSILLLTHLRARVLKSGAMQRHAELLLDLALPMGFLATRFARQEPGGSDMRFMRGMLMHVEHLVILGAITDISKQHRAQVAPSANAVHQAFDRFGPDIRQAVATAWQLKDILLGAAEDHEMAAGYARLREALICRWINRPIPTLPGVDARVLADALADIPPRVGSADDTEALSA